MGLEYYVAVPSSANLSFLGALMRLSKCPVIQTPSKTMVSSREQGEVGGKWKAYGLVPVFLDT